MNIIKILSIGLFIWILSCTKSTDDQTLTGPNTPADTVSDSSFSIVVLALDTNGIAFDVDTVWWSFSLQDSLYDGKHGAERINGRKSRWGINGDFKGADSIIVFGSYKIRVSPKCEKFANDSTFIYSPGSSHHTKNLVFKVFEICMS